MNQSIDSLSTPVRIVIAAAHHIFREGLRYLLETSPMLRVVGDTDDGPTAVRLVLDAAADILMLGVERPPGGRMHLDILETLAAVGAPTRTILMTASVDAPEVKKAVQIGAHGIIPTDSPASVLFESIDTVMCGRFWIGCDVSDVATALRKLEASRREAKAFGLTVRELQIVRAVVDGYSNKQVGQLLGIGENTVKRHLTHIFDKLGASDRVELALFTTYHRFLEGI